MYWRNDSFSEYDMIFERYIYEDLNDPQLTVSEDCSIQPTDSSATSFKECNNYS